MVFSAPIFLFGFLPAFLAVYYLTPARWRNLTILIGSYLFYGWWRLDFLGVFLLVTWWTYALGAALAGARSERARQRWLLVGVFGDLAVLGYFKYFNFGVDSFNALMQQAGAAPVTLWSVILPIGISFYVFQAISYLIDVRRGDAPAATRLIDFAAFIALFPQLIAGPVLRYKDMAGQFQERAHSFALFSAGARRFAAGLAMKVIVADSVAPLADMAFALPAPTAAEAWLGAFAYTIQLFFDFAGYSAMAIGLGLMMGFRFAENFDNPYFSQSITEFWRRWHMSLSAWLRDYLYISLGGNRRGRLRTYLNLAATMLLGGLWHGAAWTFVLWGAWHGALLALERACGVKADLERPRAALRVAVTFMLVLLGWVMFRAASVSDAISMYGAMFGQNGWAVSAEVAWRITPAPLAFMALGVVAASAMFVCRRGAGGQWSRQRPALGNIGAALLLPIAAAKAASQSYAPFLYFQF